VTMLTPVGEHELLLLWIQLVVLLVTARSLGLLAQRFRQPRVVGELAAGVLIGPSIAGRLFPDLVGWLFPGDAVQSALLLSIAWLGILLLLLVTGFETDLDLLRRLGRPVVGLSVGSLVIPLVMGFALGWVMPASLWGPGADRLAFAAFIGVALSISALPVIAKIMTEMGLMRRNVGQLTIAAGMINDLIGWMLLGVVVGLFSAGSVQVGSLLLTLGAVVLFLVLGVTVGQRVVDQVLRRARSAGGFASALTATIAVTLILGSITQAMGVEAVLGALVAGVILGRSRYQRHDVRRSVEVLSSSIFAPIFFATAGLYVDFAVLLTREGATWALAVLAVATVAKLAGSFLGGRLSGLTSTESLAAGIGLNARGAMEIVLATIGLSLGALNDASYAMIVLLAVATSMGAPPALRPVLRRLHAAPEESERLAREELLAGALIAGATSALLPTRGGLNSEVAAKVVDALLQPNASVTVLTVRARRESPDARPDLLGVQEALRGRTVEMHAEVDLDPAARILNEAGMGHRLLTLGLNDDFSGSHQLSDPVQRVIADSPVPMLLVRRGEHVRDSADLTGNPFRRVLLGVTGTRPGLAAEEVAFRLTGRYAARLLAIHVVTRGEQEAALSPAVQRQLSRVRESAGAFGAQGVFQARRAPMAADELLRTAEEWQADTIVVGATVRPIDGRPFLGHGTEWIFEHARQTVIGVVFPPNDEER
jgi:Kef-type K+ transport system membrane component KefB/nucleotide-binding universal stress UspA family protein